MFHKIKKMKPWSILHIVDTGLNTVWQTGRMISDIRNHRWCVYDFFGFLIIHMILEYDFLCFTWFSNDLL